MPALLKCAVLFLSIVLVRPVLAADALDRPAITDANLATALDVSDSIMRHEEWLEFDGIARAIVHPAFLDAILSGRHRRIGFAVYAWSSGAHFRTIVPWTVIASAEDTERVAAMLRSTPRIDRSHYGDDDDRGDRSQVAGSLTDASTAIRFGLGLIQAAPHPTERAVLNICGNGVDNVAEGPQQTRDLALATGVTINGLVVGQKSGVADYYRNNVSGGFGSFVLELAEPGHITDALVRKFQMDLIAGPAATGPWT